MRDPNSAERPWDVKFMRGPYPVVIACLIGAGFVGWWAFGVVHNAWATYWLRQDARPGTAIVTQVFPSHHNQVAYTYHVNDQEYSGTGWDEEHYRTSRVGDLPVVYFSESHPWLSSLSEPKNLHVPWVQAITSLAFTLFAWLLLAVVVALAFLAGAIERNGPRLDFGNGRWRVKIKLDVQRGLNEESRESGEP